MTSWPIRTLSEVVQVGSGSGFPVVEQGRQGEAFPFLKVSDMNLAGNQREIVTWNNTISDEVRRRLRATAFPARSLIFPKIGAAIATNKKRILTRPSCVDNNVMALIPDESQIEANYLYYLLLAKDLSDFASDSNPPSIRKTTVEAWRIRVPPLEYQRETSDILARAEGIIRLRQEARLKTQSIIPSLLLDMFGDPTLNPKGWKQVPLRDLVEEFRYGTSQKSGEQGLPTLRIPNVIGDRLDATDMKLVAVSETEAGRLRLRAGDLLFVRTNGNPDYVGRSAVFDPDVLSKAGFDAGTCVYASYLIRARLRPGQVLPGFLQAFLSSHEGRKLLREQARTSAGQYNINTEGLGSIPVPIPAMHLQEQFEEHCRNLRGIISQQTEALKAAEATFYSVLARAFDSDRTERAQVIEAVAIA